MEEKEFKKTKIEWHKKWLLAIPVILAVIAAIFLFLKFHEKADMPTLTISDASAEGVESVVSVDASINHLGDSFYPAASFVIDFDKSRLELLSVDEGNVTILCDGNEVLPEWSVNIDQSNETGKIKIMYLDITAGSEAFSNNAATENGILFRLQFRVRGTAREGDVYAIDVSDAVFAANDEAESLATTKDTLGIKNGSIAMGA